MTKLELVNIVNNISSSLKLNENFTDSQKCSMLIGTNVDLDKAEENGKIDHIYDLVMASKFASLYNAEMVMEEAIEEPIVEPVVIVDEDDEDGENSEARVEEVLIDDEDEE